jgi:hypothetical protein
MNLRQASFMPMRFLLSAILIISFSTKTFAVNDDREISHGRKTFEEDKPVKKEKALKNTIAVKVFPDAIKKTMHVVAKGSNEKEISFFVFDVEGKMIVDYTMKAGDRRTIRPLRKGNYMYHVFCGDEYIGSGKMQFR